MHRDDLSKLAVQCHQQRVARFKRKAGLTDADWDDSHPRIALELRRGRRELLSDVLEAAERVERYSLTDPGFARHRATGAVRAPQRHVEQGY